MWLAAEQVQSMKGKKKKTALRWWTECLHSYLMSYFFSEVGEMEPGGGLEQRGVGVREGGGGDLAVNAQLSIARPSIGPGAHPPKHSSPERAKVTPLPLRSRKTRRWMRNLDIWTRGVYGSCKMSVPETFKKCHIAYRPSTTCCCSCWTHCFSFNTHSLRLPAGWYTKTCPL